MLLLMIVLKSQADINPKKILLNEINSLGQQCIQIATALTDPQVTLENYVIIGYTQDTSQAIQIRALINLKRHKFGYNQKIELVGEVPLMYPDKLLDINLDSSEYVLIARPITSMNYLSVGKSQYLVVRTVTEILMSNSIGTETDQMQ